MSFEADFFGPGNRLKWEAIQAGTLAPDIKQRLGPFLEDAQRNPDLLVLPRVRENGQVQWYVLCRTPRATRIARDEVRAFLGPTYSDFDGHSTTLDPSDQVEAAVLARYGNNAFKIEVPDRALLDTARQRLRLLISLNSERPARHGRRVRAAGRVLRDFEYALLIGNDSAASESLDELRAAGHLSATNLLFLELRRLGAAERWDAILGLPELDALVSMPRPRRVTEVLIKAVYTVRLGEFEQGDRASEAVERFRSEVFPRFRDLYRSRATFSGFEADASFVMAAGAFIPARPDVADVVLASYPPGSREQAYLAALAEFVPAPAAKSGAGGLNAAREAFAEADVDVAYELALSSSPSFERSALLLLCARDISTLSAARAALNSLESLSATDRVRLNQNVALRRIRESLEELSPTETSASASTPVVVEIPSNWAMWLTRLTVPQVWGGAVAAAQVAAREWDLRTFAGDSAVVQETADLLLSDRPQWGQEALRDSLPYFVEFCLAAGPDVRLKPVYDNIFFIIAVDDQVSLPQVTALLKIVEVRLQLGVTGSGYREMISQLSSAVHAVDSPSVIPLALDAIEVFINAVCPVAEERQEFIVRVAAVFSRWHRRVDKAQFTLLRQLGRELEISHVLPDDTPGEELADSGSYWDGVDGKRLAIYSLQESALRRAAAVVTEMCPRARVNTFHDRVGGSAALRTASATADVFVMATAAAKHAATMFIQAHRPADLTTLYARGQGSASLLEALREHLQGFSSKSNR